MASTLDKTTASRDELAVVIDAEQYEEALQDERVRALHEKADAYLRDLEAQGRSL
jgi:hypothetical protein